MLKKITCPICSRRLFDTDEAEQVNMCPANQGTSTPGLFYVKCSKCSSTWAAMVGRCTRKVPSEQLSRIDVPALSIPVEGIDAGRINIQITYSVQS